jgi:MYXO-CTERM domain-containing protein
MGKRFLWAGAVTAISGLVTQNAIAASFSEMYVFGDSLSDTGNIAALTGGFFPGPLYTGGRFSNGDLWIDYLGDELGLTPTPAVLLRPGDAIPEGVNFALGGSTTGFESSADMALFGSGLQGQVQSFLDNVSPQADEEALYVVWAGANDYLPVNPTEFPPAESPEEPVANLSAAINTLFEAGARNFLVANLPDLGKFPLTLNTPLAASLSLLTDAHNAQFEVALAELNQTQPGIDIKTLDVNTLFDQAIASDFGFTVTDAACLNAETGVACSNPDDYLFWDNRHPTTATHEILGERAFAALSGQPSDGGGEMPPGIDPEMPDSGIGDPDGGQAPQDIPEPTLGLMAIAVLGAGMRRRRRSGDRSINSELKP